MATPSLSNTPSNIFCILLNETSVEMKEGRSHYSSTVHVDILKTLTLAQSAHRYDSMTDIIVFSLFSSYLSSPRALCSPFLSFIYLLWSVIGQKLKYSIMYSHKQASLFPLPHPLSSLLSSYLHSWRSDSSLWTLSSPIHVLFASPSAYLLSSSLEFLPSLMSPSPSYPHCVSM